MIVLSLIPSHEIASWLISGIGRVLEPFGLGSSGVAHEFVYVAVIVAISRWPRGFRSWAGAR